MKKTFAAVVPVFGAVLFSVVLSAASPAKTQGRAVFEAQKCNLCHSVPTAGIEATTKSDKLKGPDLVNLADSYEADWIVKFLKKAVQKDGKNHTRGFKGTDEELQSLVDWLLEQKNP